MWTRMSARDWVGVIAAAFLAVACRKVTGTVNLARLEADAETVVELEAGKEYSFWEDADYELHGPHRDEPSCFRYRIEALQGGQSVAVLDCPAFWLRGPCPGGRSRGPSGEGGDCKIPDCTLTLPTGGKTTLRAGAHRATGCVRSSFPFHQQPELKRLTLRIGS